jgi:hypothetical protein
MKKLFPVVMVILLFSACGSEKDNALPSFSVDAYDGPELKVISELASDVEYIPLETSEDCFMKFIRELKYRNEKFYLYSATELLVFSKEGKYLYKLSRQGKGPEEYLYLADYDFIPGENSILVHTGRDLQVYRETTGGFEWDRTIDYNDRPMVVTFINDRKDILSAFSLASGISRFQAKIFRLDGDTLLRMPNKYRFTKNSKITVGFSNENNILKSNGELLIKSMFSDTIFRINDDYSVEARLIMNTGGRHLSSNLLANLDNMDLGSAMSELLNITDLKIFSGYLFYRYSYNKSPHLGAYNLADGTNHKADPLAFLADDLCGGVGIDPKCTDNGILYSWVDALTLKNHLAGDGFRNFVVIDPDKKARLVQLGETLEETDNFVLIRVTPRK